MPTHTLITRNAHRHVSGCTCTRVVVPFIYINLQPRRRPNQPAGSYVLFVAIRLRDGIKRCVNTCCFLSLSLSLSPARTIWQEVSQKLNVPETMETLFGSTFSGRCAVIAICAIDRINIGVIRSRCTVSQIYVHLRRSSLFR